MDTGTWRLGQALGGDAEGVDGDLDPFWAECGGSEPPWPPGKCSASWAGGLMVGARPGQGRPLAPRLRWGRSLGGQEMRIGAKAGAETLSEEG